MFLNFHQDISRRGRREKQLARTAGKAVGGYEFLEKKISFDTFPAEDGGKSKESEDGGKSD
jgi:hypothetical protein